MNLWSSKTSSVGTPFWTLFVAPLCLFFFSVNSVPLPAVPSVLNSFSDQSSANTPANTASQPQNPAPVLRVRVNLVVVPVVVRDAAGHSIGNLRAEDFRLLDNGKPQEITQFALEKANEQPLAPPSVSQPQNASLAPPPIHMFVAPQRFTALFFDDIHLHFDNLPSVRSAALRYLSTAPLSTERVAIFTSSGQTTQEFTDDRAKLDDALNRIRPHHLPGAGMKDCPEVSHYQADQIINKHDAGALDVAVQDAMMFCGATQGLQEDIALQMALQAANRALEDGDRQARYSLSALRDVVKRLASTPGQRSIILASPGFLVTDGDIDQATVIDRAIRSRIVINALDARGLYTSSQFGDISQRVGGPATAIERTRFNNNSDIAVEGVLSEIANETGGTFFHNSNDLEEGFRRAGGIPEYTYVLGFSPSGAKLDGKFHTLKVTLNSQEKFEVTARHGYFAPSQNASAEEIAKQELEQALFSAGKTRDLPIQLLIQTVKADDPIARVTVRANVDLNELPSRSIDGQNRNELTFVTAIFDRDGKYVNGNTRVIGVHWKQEESQRPPAAGKALDVSFMLKPGEYMVRVVARDAETQQLFAETRPLQIH
jgi:VWFA-related protein